MFFSIVICILISYICVLIFGLKPALYLEVVAMITGLILVISNRSRIFTITELIAIGLVVFMQGNFLLYLYIFLEHCIRYSLPVWCSWVLSSMFSHSLSNATPALLNFYFSYPPSGNVASISNWSYIGHFG